MDLSLKQIVVVENVPTHTSFNPSFGGFISKTFIIFFMFSVLNPVSILRLVDLSLKQALMRLS